MDTLPNDLIGLINNNLEVIDSILFGNTEDFKLDNKKWINYAIHSGHPIIDSVFKNLDIETLDFICTTSLSIRRTMQIDREVVHAQLFKKLFIPGTGIKHVNKLKQLLLSLPKMKSIDKMHMIIWKFLIHLIKLNQKFHHKILDVIELVDDMCRKVHIIRLQSGDTNYINNSPVYNSDLITYVYRYGDQQLIDYYEKNVFSDPKNGLDPDSNAEFIFKLIGLVQGGREAGHLINRLIPNTRQNKDHRITAITALLKTGHNQVVKQLLSLFYGSTLEERLISVCKYADRVYKSDSGLYRFFEPAARGNNIEMCSSILEVGLYSSEYDNMTSIIHMLNCAFMYDLKSICMKILQARSLLKTTIAIYKCCHLKARTSVELIKYIEMQLGEFDQSKLQTLIIRSIQNGRLDIAEYSMELLTSRYY